MPKQIDFTLTERELAAIHQAIKSDDGRLVKRAGVIHNLHLGYCPEEVAKQYQISLATVYNYHARFKKIGVEGLPDRDRSGRPPKADEAYRHQLLTVIEMDPHELDFGFSVWTLPSLQVYMKQKTGVQLSQNRLSEVLQEEGYVYRRPKKDLSHKQDEPLREQVAEALEEVKKTQLPTGSSACCIWMKADSV